METKCKELEYIRNNVLTKQKFDDMVKKYEKNPFLDFFRDRNRYPGYRELSLIGKWLKALQGISGSDKVEKDLVESEEKYWHARLQLKIAASIKQSDDGNIICLEPDIIPKYLQDPKRTRKPDIEVTYTKIPGEKLYIEVVTFNKGIERIQKYQAIPQVIQEMVKCLKLNTKIGTNLYNLRTIPSEEDIEDALKKAGYNLKEGIISFTINLENFTIAVKEGKSPNVTNFAESKCEGKKMQPRGLPIIFARGIRDIIKKKSAQLPRDLFGVIVIDAANLAIGEDYIRDEIRNWFKNHTYCSKILGLGFISKGYGVEAGGYIEEANSEFIENPYCNYNYRINIKDIVDSLTETWHIDSACFGRYRTLFDDFYGRVPKQKYIHWQESPKKEAERILRMISTI